MQVGRATNRYPVHRTPLPRTQTSTTRRGYVPAEAYKGRNVVERCFNQLKGWRGIAMRTDKTARNHFAAIILAASLAWLDASFSNTP